MLHVNDPYRRKLLTQVGYFVDDFLSEADAEYCRQVFQDNFGGHPDTFYSTSFHPDIELKKRVSEQILDRIRPQLEATFSGFKVLGCNFLEKKPGGNNPLPLHQDWTVTDEDSYGSYTIWIPLDDTNRRNGAIRVIDGSHRADDNFRAPSLPVAFEKYRDRFDKYLKTLDMRKGQAFVFNQKLMHASWPNTGDSSRVALTIGLVPEAAELFMLYYDNASKKLSRYAMPDDMFLHYPEIIKGPGIGTLTETTTYRVKELDEAALKKALYQNRMQADTMEPLFASADHQQHFEKNGYLIQSVLGEAEIAELKDFLFSSGIKKETSYGFYVGMDHEDKELVSRMMDKIKTVVLPKLEHLLTEYRLITASYVLKDPNPIGVVPPHQDWTFVNDEIRHCSVTCWIPLQDVNMQNGCMGVIRGSNKFFSSVRPSPSPQVPSPLSKHLFGVFPYMQLLEMKAGEALFFDNRTFHASPPNITDQPRLAVGLSISQKGATLCHYYLKPGTKDTLLKYDIDPGFFMKYDNGSLSKLYDAGGVIEGYPCAGEMAFAWEDLSGDEMKARVTEAGNVYNKELATHMAKLFGEQMKSGMSVKIRNVLAIPRRIYEKIIG